MNFNFLSFFSLLFRFPTTVVKGKYSLCSFLSNFCHVCACVYKIYSCNSAFFSMTFTKHNLLVTYLLFIISKHHQCSSHKNTTLLLFLFLDTQHLNKSNKKYKKMATRFNQKPANAPAKEINHKDDMKEPTPRISLHDAEKFRGQYDITIIANPSGADENNQNEIIFTEVISGINTRVYVRDPEFITMKVELCLRYNSSYCGGQNEIEYYLVSGGQLNDDFDIDQYKRFMEVMKKPQYSGLFY